MENGSVLVACHLICNYVVLGRKTEVVIQLNGRFSAYLEYIPRTSQSGSRVSMLHVYKNELTGTACN